MFLPVCWRLIWDEKEGQRVEESNTNIVFSTTKIAYGALNILISGSNIDMIMAFYRWKFGISDKKRRNICVRLDTLNFISQSPRFGISKLRVKMYTGFGEHSLNRPLLSFPFKLTGN